ncbi:hypothetical protein LTR53_016793 [Teratosphaeriaceae sp. CCFEE 6253]|nr:hypothetical protein LTR53_016793 [Teratosphaeriaceae sp. CCFEE 6253]
MSTKRKSESLAFESAANREHEDGIGLPLQSRSNSQAKLGEGAGATEWKRLKRDEVHQRRLSAGMEHSTSVQSSNASIPTAAFAASRDNDGESDDESTSTLRDDAATHTHSHSYATDAGLAPSHKIPTSTAKDQDSLFLSDSTEAVAEILRKDREETRNTFPPPGQSDIDQADFLAVDRLKVAPRAQTPEHDDDDEAGDSEDEPTFSVIMDRIPEVSEPDVLKKPSRNAIDRKHALHQIAINYKAELEDVLKPAMQPKKPVIQWDVKFLKALAELSYYVSHQDMNKLLWAQVGERKGHQDQVHWVIARRDVLAVLSELKKQGYEPEVMGEEGFYEGELWMQK